MGVRVYWRPLHNHDGGHIASYNPHGFIISDNLAPILSEPSAALFHEFLHAYADRGKYSEKFAPLRTRFQRDGGYSFPKSGSYSSVPYAHHDEFQADEILTNLHTVYDRARKITSGYGKSAGDWNSSSLEAAPPEVRELVEGLAIPMFLSESVREMAERLFPGVLEIAQRGLQGKSLKKDYGRPNWAIPEVGEVEENERTDRGFYDLVVNGPAGKVRVMYFTMGHFKTAEAKGVTTFPILFGDGKFSTRAELSLSGVAKYDLADPKHQEMLVAVAARELATKLAHLIDVNALLAPSIERLRVLQARARIHVDLALVREIQEESRKAFLLVARYFIDQPVQKR